MKNNFLRLFLLSAYSLGSIAAVHANARLHLGQVIQQSHLKGIVTDANGQPLVSVVVTAVKNGNKVRTGTDGSFSIDAPLHSELRFSHVGFETLTMRADGMLLQVMMKESAVALADVVVVGYGTQSKTKVSGAVTEVGLDKLSSRSLNSVGEALQGKAPGVIVTNEGGDPTASPSVNIRGMGGINGENPLYVVDGTILTGTPILNPNDIESISVLKDASAAIYGARASGGVVLVTTKKGKKGKLSFTFDTKLGTQSAWRKLQPLNAAQKAQAMNTAADNAGIPRDDAYNAAVYPDGQITRTNWMNEVFQNGLLQDYDLAVNGGNEKSNVYISFNYRDQKGIVLNTQSKRYNFRVNSEHQLTNWLKVGEQVSYGYTNGNTANTTSGYTGVLLSAIYYPTNVTPYTSNGAFSGLPQQYAGSYGDVINPVAELKRLDVRNPVNTLLINPYVEMKLMDGLKFKSNFSFTKTFNQYKNFSTRRPEIGKPIFTNQLEESNATFTDILAEQTLNYTKSLGNHHVDAVAGFTFQRSSTVGNSIVGKNFDDESPAYRYLVNATQILPPTSTVFNTAISSLFLRTSYDFKSKYLLSGTVRRDGTSLLMGANKFETYYAISGGWVLSREDFMKNMAWLSNLKLRASYGVLGNLASLTQQAVSPLLNRGNIALGLSPMNQVAYYENVASSPNLRWANSKQSNVGLDMGVFKNRLNLTADYFVKDVERMILDRPLPGITGLAQQTINAGLVRDKGIELGINYNNDPAKAFQYSVGVTLTRLRNKVISLADGLNTITAGSDFRDLRSPVRIQVGQPLYAYYVLKTAGIFKSNEEASNYKNAQGNPIQPKAKAGDMKFVDANGDGVINNDDRQFVGSAYPNFTYGLSFNASYKGFDINIFANGVYGNQLFNALKYSTLSASTGQSYNLLSGVLDAWSPNHPNGSIPRLNKVDPNGNFSNTSDFYIESGSYLRIRNVTLGYTLPQSITQKIKSQAVRFYVTANNLFTLTKYTGFDPEIGLSTSGIDGGRYPQARTFMVGLNVTF